MNCRRACIVKCRKEGRRMSVYRSFVNKYYHQLMIDYELFGGIDNNVSLRTNWEYYAIGKLYDVILVYKKPK